MKNQQCFIKTDCISIFLHPNNAVLKGKFTLVMRLMVVSINISCSKLQLTKVNTSSDVLLIVGRYKKARNVVIPVKFLLQSRISVEQVNFSSHSHTLTQSHAVLSL